MHTSPSRVIYIDGIPDRFEAAKELILWMQGKGELTAPSKHELTYLMKRMDGSHVLVRHFITKTDADYEATELGIDNMGKRFGVHFREPHKDTGLQHKPVLDMVSSWLSKLVIIDTEKPKENPNYACEASRPNGLYDIASRPNGLYACEASRPNGLYACEASRPNGLYDIQRLIDYITNERDDHTVDDYTRLMLQHIYDSHIEHRCALFNCRGNAVIVWDEDQILNFFVCDYKNEDRDAY